MPPLRTSDPCLGGREALSRAGAGSARFFSSCKLRLSPLNGRDHLRISTFPELPVSTQSHELRPRRHPQSSAVLFLYRPRSTIPSSLRRVGIAVTHTLTFPAPFYDHTTSFRHGDARAAETITNPLTTT
ncbi:hypothetical protein TgHK011_007478 [Trichoderma gracile]|nr:hypothetical protein TgHK011_007478 [Trichoderma gracile]